MTTQRASSDKSGFRRVLLKLSGEAFAPSHGSGIDLDALAEITREVPAGRDDIPSKALGGAGGGALTVDPGDPQGTKALQRVFQVDIALPEEAAAAAAFGSRAYVRFSHDWEPAGQQIWRRLRQLLLSRLQV